MSKKRSIRLLPAWVILGLVLAAYAFIPTRDLGQRQWTAVAIMATTVVGLGMLTIWALLFSGLPGRIRVRLGIGAAVVLALAASTLRIYGVSGDLVPILSWRWSEPEFGTATITTPIGDVVLADYPQFLGPTRNAQLPDTHLKDWSTHPPQEMWRITVGQAWSAFSVSGTIAVTQEQREYLECVVAYDLLTGEQLWIHEDETRYATAIGGVGPRATPTIWDDRVYTVGATGILNCLDLRTGRSIWKRDFAVDHGGKIPEWGYASSPLVLGDNVIVSPGGKQDRSLVAHRLEDGEFVWGGGTTRAGYSSPSLQTVAGRDQILIFNQGSVVGHDPATGSVYWQMPWETGGGNQCVMQPLPLSDNRVFVSTGYGIGCRLYEVSESDEGMTAEILYRTPRMKAKFTQVVHHKGYIYGLDDGVFVCLDPQNGKRKWKRGRYGHGQILLVGNKLILQTEDGDIVLIRPNPDQLTEITTVPALSGKTWNNPILAGSLLIVRNDQEAICFKVELEEPET